MSIPESGFLGIPNFKLTHYLEFGGNYKTREEYVRDFIDNPKLERRLCDILKLPTEEEKRTSPGTTINIQGSHGIQIGDHNVQNIVDSFQLLINQIDNTTASEKDKNEAKGMLLKLLEHPLICSILGGAVGGLVNLIK